MNSPGERPDHRLVNAHLALQRGNTDSARTLCNAVLDEHPLLASALGLMGRIEEQAGRHDEAYQWFSAAAEADPSNPLWKQRRDANHIVNAPTRRRQRARDTQPNAVAAPAATTLRQALRDLPMPMRLALAIGAVATLGLGTWVGVTLSDRPEPLPKPNPTAPSESPVPDPIVVPPPQDPLSDTSSASPPSNNTPSATSDKTSPADAKSANLGTLVVVPGAREARWDETTRTLSLWISIAGPTPSDDIAKGQIRSTAETMVRQAIAQWPNALHAQVQVDRLDSDGTPTTIWKSSGNIGADPDPKAPLLTSEEWF